MKILNSLVVNVIARDYEDPVQTKQLLDLQDKVLELSGLSELREDDILYVPYETWRSLGGSGGVLPSKVRLVHGLDKPTINLEGSKINRRQFLVSDQASATGFAPRIHMASATLLRGQLRMNSHQACCGEVLPGHGVSPSLDSVTCPECLLELKSINVVH